MTNTKRLKSLIVLAGLTQSKVAKMLGLSYQGFYKKLVNKSEFKPSEMSKLCEILSITDLESIFFTNRVD